MDKLMYYIKLRSSACIIQLQTGQFHSGLAVTFVTLVTLILLWLIDWLIDWSIDRSIDRSIEITFENSPINTLSEHFSLAKELFMWMLHANDWLIAVRNCCNRINEQNLYSSSLSLASTSRDTVMPSSSWSSSSSPTSSVTSRRSAACVSGSVAASNCSSVISSIDTELLDVQRRLVFPKHIPVWPSVCHAVFLGLACCCQRSTFCPRHHSSCHSSDILCWCILECRISVTNIAFFFHEITSRLNT